MNLYSGPATLVEINTSDEWTGAQTDLGEAQDIQINWEPQGAELMDKSKTQNGGIGTLTMKLAEGGSTINTALKAARNVRQYIRITTADGETRVVQNVYLNYGHAGNLSDPGDLVGWPITATKWTDEPEDFVTIPTDA